MSHAPQGGRAPDQASSGRQTGAAAPLGQIIPKARNAASHLTSHKQHGDTRLTKVQDRPTRRASQTLDDIMGRRLMSARTILERLSKSDTCWAGAYLRASQSST